MAPIDREEGAGWVPTGGWGGHQQSEGGRSLFGTWGQGYLSISNGVTRALGLDPGGHPMLSSHSQGAAHRATLELVRSIFPPLSRNPPVVLRKIHKQISSSSKPPLNTIFDQRGLIFRVEATCRTLGWGGTRTGW